MPKKSGKSVQGLDVDSTRSSRRRFQDSVISTSSSNSLSPKNSQHQPRVRFAPSPTGNLHVGGARTALFNYLFAKNVGGKLILRVEDTDAARSTKESEDAVLRDLAWMGIEWDEGPDKGGAHGPYRQSERTALYREYVDKLVADGQAYPCFCTDEEITQMKADAGAYVFFSPGSRCAARGKNSETERQNSLFFISLSLDVFDSCRRIINHSTAEAKSLPPIYRGKWAKASKVDVDAELAKGTPHCFRFRVPPNRDIVIDDVVRGKVKFNTDAVGDFVILRSNGLPVYNFCVAVDDALMRVTHVLRAEEHLPNTLRQVLIYRALGFAPPSFGHMSLILAPDKSKLSKRHGATSVGEFREQGFLAPAMVNYLSLLGWNDGTEQEIFTTEQLISKFTLKRITKSAAVFDKNKLRWMNGQHLRALPEAELAAACTSSWVESGLMAAATDAASSPLVSAAVALFKTSLELVTDADSELRKVLSFPLEETLANAAAAEGDENRNAAAAAVLADNFAEIASAVVSAYDSGELAQAVSSPEGYKSWVKALGKAQERKGKRLFMPLRLALTGATAGAEVGDQLALLSLAEKDGAITESSAVVPLAQRVEKLRSWLKEQ